MAAALRPSMGVVGAGGLGQMLHLSLSLFQPQAFNVIFAMLALVLAVDAASAWLRRAPAGVWMNDGGNGIRTA